jgi:hypothetical protein
MKFERQPEKHEQIGVGGYKRAYKIEGDGSAPEVQLVMKHPYTNEQMKGLFYLNKLATLLFPGKIAEVSQAGNFLNQEGEIESSQFRAEYHEHDLLHQAMQEQAKVIDGGYAPETPQEEAAYDVFRKLSTERSRLTRRHPGIEAFRDAYEEAGFVNKDTALSIEWGPQDVIVDSKGNFVYVDVDVPWHEPEEVDEESHNSRCLRFDPKKLQVAIDGIEESKRKEAEMYYGRLMDLVKEAGFEV